MSVNQDPFILSLSTYHLWFFLFSSHIGGHIALADQRLGIAMHLHWDSSQDAMIAKAFVRQYSWEDCDLVLFDIVEAVFHLNFQQTLNQFKMLFLKI